MENNNLKANTIIVHTETVWWKKKKSLTTEEQLVSGVTPSFLISFNKSHSAEKF